MVTSVASPGIGDPIEIFATALRTGTATSGFTTPPRTARGMLFSLNVTDIDGTSLSLVMDIKDELAAAAASRYINWGGTVTTSTQAVYIMYPGTGTATPSGLESVSPLPLPPCPWRIKVVHTGGVDATYTLTAYYIG